MVILTDLIRDNSLTGLRVQPGKTLALVGGDVDLEGSTITAEGGRIELGSIGSGLVSLNSTQDGWTFGYEAVSNFQDIELTRKASADASGTGGGSIQVHGANIKLADGSVLLIQNTGETRSGSINVNASGSLVLSGFAPDQTVSSIATETVSGGDAADIVVSAQDLQLQNGAGILTGTFNAGRSGNVDINVSNSVQLFRTSAGLIERTPTPISAFTFADGDAGSISLSAQQFKAANGSIVSSESFGTGDTGNININANLVELDGLTDRDALFTSSSIYLSAA